MWSTWRSGQAHCKSCILPWISISLCLSSWSCFSSCCCCLSFSSYNFSLKNKHYTSWFTQVTLQKLCIKLCLISCCSMFSHNTIWTENTSTHHVFHIRGTNTNLALSERAISLWALGVVARVLLGCCFKPSSSLAVVPSVSSLYSNINRLREKVFHRLTKESTIKKRQVGEWVPEKRAPLYKLHSNYIWIMNDQNLKSPSRHQALTCTIATSSWSCLSFCLAVWRRWTFWA